MRISIYATLVLSGVLARAQHPCPEQLANSERLKVVDCSGGECKLPIATAAEIYRSMDKAIAEIGHDKLGFPVSVLAASYGLQDPGWKFALRPWRFKKARIEDLLRSLKRYSGSPADLPALINVNLPRLGPQFYDAGLIRSLFWTDLFPFEPKIVRISESGITTSYIVLDRSKAHEAKEVFQQRSQRLCDDARSSGDSTFLQLASLINESPGLSDSSGALLPLVTNTGPQQSQTLAGPDTLPRLQSESGYWVRIIFEPNYWVCGPWGELQLMADSDIKGLSSFFGKETGCFLKILVELPKGADEGYREITIAGNVIGDRFACSPQDFGGKSAFVTSQKCPSALSSLDAAKATRFRDSGKPRDIKWTITQEGLRGGRTEKLILATSDLGPEPEMLISLWGVRVDPGAEGELSCWCGGGDRGSCTQDELKECRVLPIK